MRLLSFSRPNKKDRAVTVRERPTTTWFAPVLPDWFDSKIASSSPPDSTLPATQKPRNRRARPSLSRRIIERWASNFATTTDQNKTNKRTVPGNHPIGTPRTKNTGRRRTDMTSMNNTLSLPPGAAAPALGRVLDYDLNNSEYFSRPSFHYRTDDCGQSTIRCMSLSLDAYITGAQVTVHNNLHRPFSAIMSRNTTGAPAIPPRSHLRGTSPGYTKASSSSSSPMASGRSSPNRPYVLDVEPPTSEFGYSAEPSEEIICFRAGPQRQLSYEHPARTSHHHKRASFDDRDPLKIRDHRPPRKSASGVYTPPSFPGAGGRPSPSESLPSPTPSSSSSQQTSPDAGYSWLRPRTFGGFKRLSTDGGNPPPPPPKGFANHTSHYPRPSGVVYGAVAHSSAVYTPASMPSTPYTPRMASHGSRSSFSPPSSAQSVKSVSPPATPTSPASLSAERITIAGDSVDDLTPLDVDPTPKPSPRPAQIPLVPGAERTVPPLSPTAPKRARRKPVPRLDDDLVKRLEAVEV